MLLLPNSFEIFMTFLALARLGCVGVPAGIRLTVPELSTMARDAGCRWVLTSEDLGAKAWESRPDPDCRG
jgi:acyl-coenzyme A synthetase/AMP-(fatty) acid ligase